MSGTTWFNFRTYVDAMYQACTNRYAGSGVVSAFNTLACRLDVDTYFGQTMFSVGFANFEGSNAALDAWSSRYGQACETVKAAIIKNNCANL